MLINPKNLKLGQIFDNFEFVKALLLILSTVFLTLSYGQNKSDSTANYNDSLITISGSVLDTTKSITFFNIMVVNKTIGRGIFGDYDGTFSITVKKSDKIGISVTGYKTQYFSFKSKPYQKEYNLTVYLDLIEFESKAVEVKPLKTLAKLKEERAAIAKRELPKVTVITSIQSPITALYNTFSKREKTKRMIAEMDYQDQQNAVVKEILRVYVHADILDLDGDDFEAFITFLNLNDTFLKTATDYELIIYIKQKYEHFKNINANGY